MTNMKIIVGENTEVSCENMMQGIKNKKIKQHLLGNAAMRRHGSTEQKELSEYRDFLKTKAFADLMELTGSIDYEKY